MDFFGIVRRIIGAVGVILVSFGFADQTEASSLTTNVEAIIGGAMFLIDFVPSIIGKIKGRAA